MKKFYLFLLASILSIPAMMAGQVYFYFQDGEEDDFELEYPSSLVSIWNATVEEPVTVPEDMNFMSYIPDGAVILRISPSDFDYELVVSVDGNEDMYMLDKEETEWYLTLLPDANDLEIYVKVYLAGTAPGGDTISEVSMSFNVSAASGSDIANPGELLGISYFDRTNFQTANVSIEDNYGSAAVVPGTTFTVSPAEGYIISDITTYSFGVASISQPGEGDVEWYVAVDENPADNFASFFITLDKASGEGPGGGDEPDQPGERSQYAVITQIEPLQWTVTWEDYDFINSLDSEFDGTYAYLTDANGNKTILHANLHGYENPQIFFPSEYGNYFTLNLEGLGLADGTYQLTIPAEYVSLVEYGVNKVPNPEQQLSLTVGDTPDVSYTVQISALYDNYFDITWENVTMLAEGNTTGAYMVNVATNERYEMYFLEDYMYSKANLRIYNDNALRVSVTNNYPDLPTGTYKFYLPANYVTFNGTSTGNAPIDGYEFTYTRPWSEGEVELNGPSDDNKLTVTWVDASEILYDTTYPGDGNKIKGITIYDGNDNQIDVSYSDNITISGNSMIIDLNGLDLVPGQCNLLIPEECLYVTVDGVTDLTYGISLPFTYGESQGNDTPDLYTGPATWNVRSGSTVKAGSFVEVGWGDFELAIVEDAEQASIHTFETGILYLEYGSEVYLSDDKTKIVLDLSNMPSGKFRINVAEACVQFTVNGVTYRNQATSMDNVIIDNSGSVTSVIADQDGHFRVVNLNGVVILDTDNAADVINLPKGFYIINGKKVIK